MANSSEYDKITNNSEKDVTWCGEDYSPEISTDKWVELINNSGIFNEGTLKVLMRFKDYGGAATCKQLAEKYGGSPSFYNLTCTQLAQKINKQTNCPLYKDGQDKDARYWPILFIGKYTSDKKDGIYIWKLRPELSAALDKVSLPYDKLYVSGTDKMTADERKKCFENWALAKSQSRGISQNTVKGYIRSLERAWKRSTITDKNQSPYDYHYYNDMWNLEQLYSAFKENGDFADSDCRLGFELYLEFLHTLKDQPFSSELISFRNLLKWFVWQIRVNNDILQGEHHSGNGQEDDDTIRSFYDAWREYEGLTLDCILYTDFHKDTSANHIHLNGTGINIEPVFIKEGEKSDVAALQITIKQNDETIRQYPAFSIEDMYVDNDDYSGDYCPYYLKDFFALFKEEIKFHQSRQTDDNTEKNSMSEKQPKNIILYGPPGTGKTYNTVLKAMQIIAPEKHYDNATYAEAKTEYDKLLGDRIQFITFHQSYGYEEFIEGIKPETTEDGQIRYEIKSGVFKTFCEKAGAPVLGNTKEDFGLNPDAAVWKVSLEGTGDNATRRECLDNGHIRIGFDSYGPDISDETLYSSETSGKSILNSFINKMQPGDLVLSCYSATTIDAIGVITGDYEWHDEYDKYKRLRKVIWLAKDIKEDITKINNNKKLVQPTVYELNVSVNDVLNIADKYNPPVKVSKNNLPYVFIIDEINRGNISKIFGELITLIEESKRAGESEETKVVLPYSNKTFTVPSNVYIIGTMNTADRSIAAIDTALRRRFHFEEMLPDTEILKGITVENIDISLMLETINRRIEVLFDREHTIGHAYFMGLKTDADILSLAEIFKMKVIPLLQEYFYEDYEKIRLILGDNQKTNTDLQFVVSNKVVPDDLFGENSGIELDAEYTYSINEKALLDPLAYIGIYSKQTAGLS